MLHIFFFFACAQMLMGFIGCHPNGLHRSNKMKIDGNDNVTTMHCLFTYAETNNKRGKNNLK